MDVYIETLGCPKNMCDSEAAAGLLERAGHRVTGNAAGAGAVLVNTCGFIDDAKRESIAKIFEMAQAKAEGALLIVSGCLPERYREKLYRQMPEVDVFIGVNDYPALPGIIESYSGKRAKFFSEWEKEYAEMPRSRCFGKPFSAAVKIAEGCDNACAYCVIPSIRGGCRSRKKENILHEAAWLAENGCKELILVAQDVTAYGADIYGRLELPGLLRGICRIDGIHWVRLMYCYEDRVTDELVETMKSEEKICKYIDIPVQHCSDKILSAMNRRSTKASITSTVEKLRKAMPDIHIRSTVITGLPGEGQKEFAELFEFVEQMRFERLGVFTYSKEEGTPAAKMKPQVRADVKESRKNAIMLKQLEISLEQNTEKIGKVFETIVEGTDSEGACFGRSRYDAPEIDNSVIFSSDRECRPGDIVNVEVTDAFDYDVIGREVRG
ncbi:MAG: 30S ribosomal protein S12 methylthiotransferase RimO [Clostridiales bacterium]|nr:30S ribosomal protein S12 methylthiotransferase RimO [Clostridiales bacterium]